MNDLVKRYPIAAALAGVAALLAVIVVLEAATGPSAGAGAGKAPSANVLQAKLLPPLPPTPSEAAYPEMSARPLFTPTRRPAPASTSLASSSMPKGTFVLSGVTIANGLRIALLREKSSGRVVRVEQGRDVNGMTVATIEPERVTLAMGNDQEVLSLQVQKGPAAGVTPPPVQMQSAGPFGGAPGAAAAVPPAATAPPPAQPQPALPARQNNPAARPPQPASAGGFGPYPASPDAPQAAEANPNQAAPLTPEELLARRRARRTQPSR